MLVKKGALAALFIACLLHFYEGNAQTAASNTDEAKVPPYRLPDVLKMQNGKPVKSVGDWNHLQRAYIYSTADFMQK